MPKPLPIEIRERVLEVVEKDGLTIESAARRFKVGTATVKRWLRRSRTTGTVVPDPMGGVRKIWVGADERQQLVDLVEVMADATLMELAEAYNARHETSLSRSALLRALQRFEITRKKSPCVPPKRRPLALLTRKRRSSSSSP